MAAYPPVPRDGNADPLPNVGYDPVGHQFVAPQSGGVQTDSSGNGVVYAPALVSLASQLMTAPAIVQKASAVSSGGVAALTATFASNVTPGNTIVVVCGVGNGTAATVTDSLSNTFNSAVNAANSTTFAAQIFWASAIVGGPDTVTVTPSTSVSVAVQIYEVAGLLTLASGVLGQTSAGSGTSATAAASNIAGYANSFAFAGVAVGTAAQAVTAATGTSWKLDSSQNVGGTPSGLFTFGALSLPLSNVGAVAAKATLASSEPYACAVAVFKPLVLAVQGGFSLDGYNYTNITLAAPTTTLVKNGPGLLHTITINTPVASSVITIYDNTAGSGTKIGTITLPGTLLQQGPYSAAYDVPFSTGLTIVTATGASDITVAWR